MCRDFCRGDIITSLITSVTFISAAFLDPSSYAQFFGSYFIYLFLQMALLEFPGENNPLTIKDKQLAIHYGSPTVYCDKLKDKTIVKNN